MGTAGDLTRSDGVGGQPEQECGATPDDLLTRLVLDPPDWTALIGEASEAQWIADRDRKFGRIAELAARFRKTADSLARRQALFACSPDVLREIPLAADWFISLIGLAKNTLKNVKSGPRNFGLTIRAETVVKNLDEGRQVADENLSAFSEWINSEVDVLYPEEQQTRAVGEATVLMVLGGRVVGQGQNVSGDDAVVLVKTHLVDALDASGAVVEVRMDDGTWRANEPGQNLAERTHIRYSGRLTLDFGSGGNRPDLIITLDGACVAVAEIKGRKDLSNVWESWMPTIHGHLITWAAERPSAARLFIGTLISPEMVEGVSRTGTPHVGLKQMHKEGLLTAAYNVSKVAEHDAAAVASFQNLAGALRALVR